MRRQLVYATIVFLLTGSLPTVANARSIYFYKAGVDRATFVAEAQDCESLATGVQAPVIAQPYSANLYAAGAAGFLAGFMRSRERRGLVENVLRTCMADKGYRRVEAAKDVEQSIGKLSGPDRLQRLAVLAAADEPYGRMLPR